MIPFLLLLGVAVFNVNYASVPIVWLVIALTLGIGCIGILVGSLARRFVQIRKAETAVGVGLNTSSSD